MLESFLLHPQNACNSIFRFIHSSWQRRWTINCMALNEIFFCKEHNIWAIINYNRIYKIYWIKCEFLHPFPCEMICIFECILNDNHNKKNWNHKERTNKMTRNGYVIFIAVHWVMGPKIKSSKLSKIIKKISKIIGLKSLLFHHKLIQLLHEKHLCTSCDIHESAAKKKHKHETNKQP